MKIKVKFGKETHDEVELDTTGSVGDFKAVIYSITNVPAERQKLMVKGGWSKKGFMGTLKDDFDFSDLKIPEGSLVTVMGTADVLAAPKEVTKFVEDMTEEEKDEEFTKRYTLPKPYEKKPDYEEKI